MAYRFQVTYDDPIDILDLKNIPTTTIRYTPPPGMYEIIDINFMLKSLLPTETNVKFTIDNIRPKSNLNSNKTIKFTKKYFFYVILCFTQSHSGEIGDFEGFVQLIPTAYKSYKPINITGTDKVHLKADCIQGSIVNGTRQPSF